jgi:hypothetical protein
MEFCIVLLGVAHERESAELGAEGCAATALLAATVFAHVMLPIVQNNIY